MRSKRDVNIFSLLVYLAKYLSACYLPIHQSLEQKCHKRWEDTDSLQLSQKLSKKISIQKVDGKYVSWYRLCRIRKDSKSESMFYQLYKSNQSLKGNP